MDKIYYQKRNTDTVALISGGLNPTEKTATISLPDSDTIPIILGEQPSSEIRKIRDEDIIDNPDIAQQSKPHIPHHQHNLSKPHRITCTTNRKKYRSSQTIVQGFVPQWRFSTVDSEFSTKISQ